MFWKAVTAMALLVGLAGCGVPLPSSGPLVKDIDTLDNANYPKPPYLLIDLDEKVTNITGQFRPPSFASFFKVADRSPTVRLAVGDKVSINIFEAGADGLFSSSAAKATQIQAVIDETGQVFVPYVGAVQAAGGSPESLRTTIEASLEDKAIQPQVQVLVAESVANSVTVLGDVNTPGVVPVTVAGARILDVIASAGGTKTETFEAQVTLRRGKTVASANLEDLFDDPANNVRVNSGDVILVGDATKTFTVFGAAATKQEFKFEARRVTLAEGLARAGGLDDNLADARGVFIFRFEPDFIAKALDKRAVTTAEGSMVPTIYNVNLKHPNTFFLMPLFELRDEDIIYVANHPSAQLGKFLQIVSPIINTAVTVATLTTRFTD
ncbi:MAG: polysaccharide biosynthesis/export family protein [Pseudomonadota bacterium]